MSYHVIDLLRDRNEWTVKRKVINGLDDTVASCQRSGGPCKLVGLDEILDDAYLSGFYEAHVVDTEEGRGILEHAGVLDDPESIFSDDLRCERNRRKQMNMACEENIGTCVYQFIAEFFNEPTTSTTVAQVESSSPTGSTFSDDLRRERNRRKQMNMGCEDTNGTSMC